MRRVVTLFSYESLDLLPQVYLENRSSFKCQVDTLAQGHIKNNTLWSIYLIIQVQEQNTTFVRSDTRSSFKTVRITLRSNVFPLIKDGFDMNYLLLTPVL